MLSITHAFLPFRRHTLARFHGRTHVHSVMLRHFYVSTFYTVALAHLCTLTHAYLQTHKLSDVCTVTLLHTLHTSTLVPRTSFVFAFLCVFNLVCYTVILVPCCCFACRTCLSHRTLACLTLLHFCCNFPANLFAHKYLFTCFVHWLRYSQSYAPHVLHWRRLLHFPTCCTVAALLLGNAFALLMLM